MAASSLDAYLNPLLCGNRIACRRVVQQRLEEIDDPTVLYHELLWPAMEKVEKLYRNDRINAVVESMATRINRAIADQLQLRLPMRDPNGKRILIAAAPGEPEELGAQMCADLFESRGWEVYFVGGPVPNDELMSLCGKLRPDVLMIYGTQPHGVPAIRELIEQIRTIGINPTMNILVSGGVYNRADGLWKEVSADLFAKTIKDAIPLAESAPPRDPEAQRKSGGKKRRRRRRSPLLAAAE
ncbi:MAG: hypothetical protein D6788_08430 [Planctomycetota bacterium]|nr:MAG: hypothetical protein D6788_08430 [Planctomycetota bacterium]